MVERVYGQFVNIRDLEREKGIKNLKYFKKTGVWQSEIKVVYVCFF